MKKLLVSLALGLSLLTAATFAPAQTAAPAAAVASEAKAEALVAWSSSCNDTRKLH